MADASSPLSPSPSKVGATLSATLLAAAGIVCSVLVAVPVVVATGFDADTSATALPAIAVFVASYAGMALVAVWYALWRADGWGYFDVRWPTRRDATYVLGGTLLAYGAVIVVGVAVDLLGLQTTPNAVLEPALDGDVDFLLMLVPLVLLVNAPVEELLFRGVVQQSLYRTFSKGEAVVVASVVFALVHVPAYWSTPAGATAVSVSLIFVGSLVFGWVYARTENLVVPALVHGLFNAVQVGLLYVYLSGGGTVELALPLR